MDEKAHKKLKKNKAAKKHLKNRRKNKRKYTDNAQKQETQKKQK